MSVCEFARTGSENIYKACNALERNSSNKRCIILNARNSDSGNSCTRVSISRQRRYHMTAHVKAAWSPLVDSHPLSHSPRRGLLARPLPPPTPGASMKSPSLCLDQMELLAEGVRVLPPPCNFHYQ